jgi:hypothetical protein
MTRQNQNKTIKTRQDNHKTSRQVNQMAGQDKNERQANENRLFLRQMPNVDEVRYQVGRINKSRRTRTTSQDKARTTCQDKLLD